VTSTATAVLDPTVVSDATGTHLALTDGDIWTSDDAGATWIDRTAGTSAAAQWWIDLASDASGAHLVALDSYTDIWTSADSGATWTNRTKGTAASGQEWQSVTSDSSGTHLVAVSEFRRWETRGRSGRPWTRGRPGSTERLRPVLQAESGQPWRPTRRAPTSSRRPPGASGRLRTQA
jgi:hypothetical protein